MYSLREYAENGEVDVIYLDSTGKSVSVKSNRNLILTTLFTNGTEFYGMARVPSVDKSNGIVFVYNYQNMQQVCKEFPHICLNANWQEKKNQVLGVSLLMREIWEGIKNDAYRS